MYVCVCVCKVRRTKWAETVVPTQRVCCLLVLSVLDSVTSTPQWIRQPKPRGFALFSRRTLYDFSAISLIAAVRGLAGVRCLGNGVSHNGPGLVDTMLGKDEMGDPQTGQCKREEQHNLHLDQAMQRR